MVKLPSETLKKTPNYTTKNPINLARQAAGLSIKNLSELLEAPYRTIQEYCSGENQPPAWVERLVLQEIECFAEANQELAAKRNGSLKNFKEVRQALDSFKFSRTQPTTSEKIVNMLCEYMINFLPKEVENKV